VQPLPVGIGRALYLQAGEQAGGRGVHGYGRRRTARSVTATP
jgi:hypothetical protein